MSSPYRLSFTAGSSGRFISTILYGLLYDPCPIEYTYGSAHEFQLSNSQAMDKFWLPDRDWHSLPVQWDSNLKYVIIKFSDIDLPEIAHNNLHKNTLWNLRRKEYGLSYREQAVQSFNNIYLETYKSKWNRGSIQNLTVSELCDIEKTMIRWLSNSNNSQFKDPQVPMGISSVIINYSDIYRSTSDSSWYALDQLIEYTGIQIVHAQVRDNYRRYVEYRNSKFNQIGTV